jgi:hypothetical protein
VWLGRRLPLVTRLTAATLQRCQYGGRKLQRMMKIRDDTADGRHELFGRPRRGVAAASGTCSRIGAAAPYPGHAGRLLEVANLHIQQLLSRRRVQP